MVKMPTIKFLLKRKIEKMFAVEVTKITKTEIHVKPTDVKVKFLNLDSLKFAIGLECDEKVVIDE